MKGINCGNQVNINRFENLPDPVRRQMDVGTSKIEIIQRQD